MKNATDNSTGFKGLDGAKVFRGTAKGFLDDISDDDLQCTLCLGLLTPVTRFYTLPCNYVDMNGIMRKYLQPELLQLFGVDSS